MRKSSCNNSNTDRENHNQNKTKTVNKEKAGLASYFKEEKPENSVAVDNHICDTPNPTSYSTPKKRHFTGTTASRFQVESTESTGSITDQEILQEQTLTPGEPHPEDSRFEDTIRAVLSVSRNNLFSKEQPVDTKVSGLPDQIAFKKHSPTLDPELLEVSRPKSFSFQTIAGEKLPQYQEMGTNESKSRSSTLPKNIMSESIEFSGNRKRIVESEVTGNCRPWSDHVFYKLFLDIDGRQATLMVIKCEITYIDVFTDEEHTLYKGRFIGGKKDGVAQMFSFDLMKSRWEEKIPPSQAIELNVDIVMSSSPIYQCAETLLHLLQLEKAYLKHRQFDGQLNIMIRFAHSCGWDIKDDTTRNRTHDGLRNLFKEGVNMEVMSVDVILEEMRADGILAINDESIRRYTAKRQGWEGTHSKWTSPETSTENSNNDHQTEGDYNYAKGQRESTRKADNLVSMTDFYYVTLHDELWNIIQDLRKIKDNPEEKSKDTADSLFRAT